MKSLGTSDFNVFFEHQMFIIKKKKKQFFTESFVINVHTTTFVGFEITSNTRNLVFIIYMLNVKSYATTIITLAFGKV